MFRRFLRRIALARSLPDKPISFHGDGMLLWGKNPGFIQGERFDRAYRAGMAAAGQFSHIPLQYRLHTVLWAAEHASKLDGDFVECGVNTGIFSLAILDYLDLSKTFWLFDTFNGIPPEQIQDGETRGKSYPDVFEDAKRAFAPYPNAKLVRGVVPDSLVPVERVAYLSIDMNIAYPERAAIEHFWPSIVPGGVVVLDDYAFVTHEAQQRTMDEFARQVGVGILTLPTGQGLIIKHSSTVSASRA